MTLLELLRVLSSVDSPPRQRNAALLELQSTLRKNVAQAPRFKAAKGKNETFTASESVLEDAVTKVVMEAARLPGKRGITATTEAGAWAWARTVMARYLIHVWRKDSPRPKAPKKADANAKESAAEEQPVTMPKAARNTGADSGVSWAPEWSQHEIDKLLTRIREVVERGQGAAGGFPPKRFALECYLRHRAGDSIDEQIKDFGFAGPYEPRDDEVSRRRARDRVYQYRKRGADARAKALLSLGTSGAYDPTELAEVAAMFRVELGAPVPKPAAVGSLSSGRAAPSGEPSDPDLTSIHSGTL